MSEDDKNSFEETVKIINTFGNKSGLLLNAGKTSAIWLGSKRNSPIKYMPNLHMDWNPRNFREKCLKIKALYKVWLKTQIT